MVVLKHLLEEPFISPAWGDFNLIMETTLALILWNYFHFKRLSIWGGDEALYNLKICVL